VRVTTYFEDTVERVAEMVEREFLVDGKNSVNKAALLDPDRFGYLSRHHVVTLSQERSKLAEYRRFEGHQIEIQTRSILQHAWAEIEHDLGYKSSEALPVEVRRRFARLAGLLELADKEFTEIRVELESYRSGIKSRISRQPDTVLIDLASLSAYVWGDSAARRIDQRIVDAVGAKLEQPSEEFLEDDPKVLVGLGISTIEELDRQLVDLEETIVAFATAWIGPGGIDSLAPGICLFYLWYISIAESGSRSDIAQLLESRYIGTPEDSWQLAGKVIEKLRAARAHLDSSPQ
jgi:putative GTP pyrophosphokinase